MNALLARRRDLAAALPPAGRRHVAHAARNNDTVAARMMLDAGLPASGCFSQHHGSPLHWAAWHGNAALVRLLLPHRPPLEDADNEFHATPLGWAVHGSENGWDRQRGDYTATVQALLDAGCRPPERAEGTEAVQAVLRRHGVR
jgi:ankyrin repeat protein